MRAIKREKSPMEIVHCTIAAADVAALGAVLTGTIKIADLKKGTRIAHSTIVVKTPGAGTTTLTATLGFTATGYADLHAARDVKAAANTVYATEVATPILAADQAIYTKLTATVENLALVTGLVLEIHMELVRVYN